MAFAQPIALALLALFVPVILLYMLKQRRRHVHVSTLLFWDRILRDEHSVTSRTRLRKILSLLLQLLVLAALTLALARPTFSKELLGARRIVILLDVSASMLAQETDGTRFDRARENAADEIRAVSLGDAAMLVAVGAHADVVSPFTDSRKDLEDALDTIDATHGDADWPAAFALVRHLAPDPRETYVYVITDGAFDEVALEPPARTQFAYLRVGDAKENVGITAFQVRPLPASPRDFEIFFEATNAGESERRVPFEVRVADQLVDAGELTLAAGASEVRSVKQFSSEGGTVELALDSSDAFPLDDRAYGVLPAAERIPVLLVSENNLFLESALGTDDGIALETIAPANYPGERAAPPKVTVFDRWSPDATPPGATVFLAAWPADYGLETKGGLNDAIVTDWDKDHAVGQHISLKNITVPKAKKVAAGAVFTALVRSFDDPLVVARKTDAGESLAFAFDAAETDLPLRVAYPILVSNAIRYLAGAEKDAGWQSPEIGQILAPDEVIAFQKRQGHHADETLARTAAPGDALAAPFAAGVLLPVTRAGVYYGETAEGERFPLFAANVNSRRESRVAPAPALPVKSPQPLPQIAPGFRLGVEPWLALAMIAFVVVTAEWWLYHRRIVE
ncbi:MAG: VWA domain-containing protein [Candidatus Hydrogenedentes bacterium]|nr:VWA domain-containing protein [Candidatus Hydrogenedentota bacterium]